MEVPMAICERCLEQHDGSYGSGRFCSSRCARGFSTAAKREEISKRVSKTLTGKPHPTKRKPTQKKEGKEKPAPPVKQETFDIKRISKKSRLWQIPREELEEVVKNSKTLSDILRVVDLNNKGHNYKTLKRRLQYEGIDYSHIRTGQGVAWNKGLKGAQKYHKIPLKDILKKGPRTVDTD